jgi:hypothetical protein
MSDDIEPSPASAGSQPVAWAAVGKNGVPMWLAYHRQDAEGAVVGMAEVVPLYRQPKPTLTDEEREAIEWAAAAEWGKNPHAATLYGLLEKHKGGER